MKTKAFLSLGASLLLAAGVASAQPVVIRIVASNGDRQATQRAIANVLTNWTFQGLNGSTASATPGTLNVATGSNFGAWNGSFNGQPVIVKTSYAGALAGIAAVASNPRVPQRFVVTDGTGAGSVPNPLTGTTEGTDFELGVADFGFSTNFQTTSPFRGAFEGRQYDLLNEEIVGVSPLGFYASPGFPADNITTQLGQLLYTTGSLPVALFTGDWQNHGNQIVYAIGRNTDAGQRFGAYAELGLGVTATAQVWQPTITGQTTQSGVTFGGTVGSHRLWPAETVSGIFSPEGSGGFNAGATLAPVLTAVLGPDAYKGKTVDPDTQVETFLYPNATAGYYIGYLTPGDANSRVIGGVVPAQNRGVALKFNGVELTTANVQSGRYTAWLYNRLLRPQSGLTGLKADFATALANEIKANTATEGGGIKNDASFRVRRTTDGGLVIPKP
ncbi:MAG: hypothetical protein SFU53_11800 [Terrimicrobiaceae bacterium]|nr:hypothetical protein [Terrimicrobiaceae bacterium]